MLLCGIGSLVATPALAVPRPTITLAWRGRARVSTGGRTLDLIVETRVEPFRRARSRSWIAAEGEASARTLVIEPDAGWMERGGARVSLPAPLIAHERQQYGIYGYLVRALRAREDEVSLNLREPGFPEAHFRLDGGCPTSADYDVAAADGTGTTAQRFIFSGATPGNVRWPARIAIEQDGTPYFTLDIERFAVTPA